MVSTLEKDMIAEVLGEGRKFIATVDSMSYTVTRDTQITGSLRFKHIANNCNWPTRKILLKPFDIKMTVVLGQLTWAATIHKVELLDGGYIPNDIEEGKRYTFVAGGATEWTVVKDDDDHKGKVYNEYTGQWVWL